MPTALGFLNTTAQQLAQSSNKNDLIGLYVEYDIKNFHELNDEERAAAEGRFGLKGDALTKAYNDSRVYELARAIYTREAERLISYHAQYATTYSFKVIAGVIATSTVLAGALATTAPASIPLAGKVITTLICASPALLGMYKAGRMLVHRVKEGELRSKQHMLEHHVYLDIRNDPHGDGQWIRFSDNRGVNQRAREPVRLNAEALKRTQAIVAKLG